MPAVLTPETCSKPLLSLLKAIGLAIVIAVVEPLIAFAMDDSEHVI